MNALKTLFYKIFQVLFFALITNNIYSQGLAFNSNSKLIGERTSFHLFGDKTKKFEKNFRLEFDLSLYNSKSFGYILYFNDEISKNIYSVTFAYKDDLRSVLKFNIDGIEAKIAIELDNSKLGKYNWHRVSMQFDLRQDKLLLQFNDDTYIANNLGLKSKIEPKLYFGKNRISVDVPDFAIKNLKISDERQDVDIDLNEAVGSVVHDNVGNVVGNVQNPIWLINDSYYWRKRIEITSRSVATVIFNEKQQSFLLLNKDSVINYSFQTEEVKYNKYAVPIPVDMKLGLSFLDSAHNSAFVYELNNLPVGACTLAKLDLDSYSWTALSKNFLHTQRHHHSQIMDVEEGKHLIFGGYGNLKYSNEFVEYSIPENEWRIGAFRGDSIYPRFFSSMGKSPDGKVYLFGGTGNKSGDQSIGRVYFYDCFKIDTKKKKIQKLWNAPKPEVNFVSVRSLCFTTDDPDNFYTLSYPEYNVNTYLQLHKYNVSDGNCEVLGDSITMISERITSNANLYYNQTTKEFFAYTQEFFDDNRNKITIYSISAPVVTLSQIAHYDDKRSSNIYLLLFLVLLVTSSLIVVIYRWRAKRNKIKSEAIAILYQKDSLSKPPSDKQYSNINAIYLLDGFSAFDNKGKDITYMFSHKLRDMLLLILISTIHEDGISALDLQTALWPNKPQANAKNLRGVTIKNLRDILDDIDGISIDYANGYYKLSFTDNFYCDYFEAYHLITSPDIKGEHKINLLISLIQGKTFLKSVDSPSLDKVKQGYSEKLSSILISSIEEEYEKKNFLQVLRLSYLYAKVEPFDEINLYYKIQSLLHLRLIRHARKIFLTYTIEYNNTFNTEFVYSFDQFAKAQIDEIKIKI